MAYRRLRRQRALCEYFYVLRVSVYLLQGKVG